MLGRMAADTGLRMLVSTLAVDETAMALLRLAYLNENGRKPEPAFFKRHPADVQRYAPGVVARVNTLLGMPCVSLVPSPAPQSAALVRDALALLSATGLEPRDSFHLALAHGAAAAAIVTMDSDFLRLPAFQAPRAMDIFVPS